MGMHSVGNDCYRRLASLEPVKGSEPKNFPKEFAEDEDEFPKISNEKPINMKKQLRRNLRRLGAQSNGGGMCQCGCGEVPKLDLVKAAQEVGSKDECRSDSSWDTQRQMIRQIGKSWQRQKMQK